MSTDNTNITDKTDAPLFTLNDVPDGSYRANPRACGVIKTAKAGARQFAIEVSLKVPVELEDGKKGIERVNATKFGGIDTDEGMLYAIQDAENVGCDINEPDMEKWVVNPDLSVIVKVETDDYGKKIKSIFPDKPLEAGFMIKKQAIPEDERALQMQDINARMAAVRASRAAGKQIEKSSGPKADAGPTETVKKNKRVPI
jgi:hypothetical protein